MPLHRKALSPLKGEPGQTPPYQAQLTYPPCPKSTRWWHLWSPGTGRRDPSHSLRARLARSHTRREPRSAQDPERRGKVAPAFAPRLIALGSAFAPWLRRACEILPSLSGTSGTPAAAASASRTAGSLDNNSGGRPQRGAPNQCSRGSGDPDRPPPPGRGASVVPACNASTGEPLLLCPLGGGRAKLRLQTPSRGLE